MKIIIRGFRVAWACSWAFLATCLLFFPIIMAALLSRTGNLAFSISKIWAHIMLAATFVRVEIKGRDRIVPGQSYIIISNHQSHYDILALVTRLGLQFRWIIKRELLKVPFFGYALYASRNIFINRKDTASAIRSINRGMDRLPETASVMVFAEGTRSADGDIKEFKKGGFRIAVTRGLPILPVRVIGSRDVLPKGSLAVRPGRIRVVVGDPIVTAGCSPDVMPELMEKTRQAVLDLK